MNVETEESSLSRRRMIVRDSLAFFSLVLITVALFGVTLLLFRSFMAHRVELATRWSERGRTALAQGHAEQAVTAYRAALSYAPDEHADELMLARALGEAGRTEESYNYFMELWEQRPGDGSINLQLARLAAKKHEVQDAIRSYRASIYGTWEGDGVERRREVRLELARYLVAQKDFAAGRNELLVAGGNAPDTAAFDIKLAGLLEEAEALPDALRSYEKALAHEPKDETALRAAGRLAFALGDYAKAHRLLLRASRLGGTGVPKSAVLLEQSARILQLEPDETLPARERVARIMTARTIAKRRLDACMAQPGVEAAGSLQALSARWIGVDGTATSAVLLHDEDRQTSALQLVYDTELAADGVCGTPVGDDALLVLLAKAATTGDN
jgi:tetratricopeptide (TPR) repeat protein